MTIEIANRLCAYRKHYGLSQEELAEKIGVTRQAVSKWERAEASPDTDNLILLSQVYNVTLDDLLHRDPDTDTEEKPEPENTELSEEVNLLSAEFSEEPESWEESESDEYLYTDDIENADTAENNEAARWLKRWNHFPWPLVCCILYLLMGFFDVLGGWAIGWLVFLTIPLYYTLSDAIAKRNPKHFCYPVLVALIYLILGFCCGWWHPAWILFMTIPLYYYF